MTHQQFTLKAEQALADGVLALTYTDGEQLPLSVLPIIERHPGHIPARQSGRMGR